MTPLLETPPPPPEAEVERSFEYGTRYIHVTRPDGTEGLEPVPMSLEDLLHPEEGDDIPMRPLHFRECAHVKNVIQTRLARLHGGAVLADCLVDWGVPGVLPHQPDIVLFEEVRIPPDIRRGKFKLGPSGGRCVLVMEIVSPDRRRNNDVVEKMREYFQAGVPWYILVDEEREDGPRRLRHFRPGKGRYKEQPLDENESVVVKALGLRLEMRDDQLVLRELDTGEELGDYAQVEEARQRAEERERREAKARHAAEKRQRAAEERQRQEAAARHAAEERLRELEAELRRLRGQETEKPPRTD